MTGKRRARDDRDGSHKRKKKWDAGRPIKGPGIFVSCVRGKERKAADELIEFLDEIAVKFHDEVLRDDAKSARPDQQSEPLSPSDQKAPKDTGDDIEAQIKAELADLQGKGCQKGSKPSSPFTLMMTDMECFFFVSVAAPIDPVKVTCALLEEVKRTGKARSRYVQRLSPVQNTVHAEEEEIRELTQKVVIDEPGLIDSNAQTTFKVDLKMRLHNRLAKLDVIRIVASCMPTHVKAHLKAPDLVVNVEVFRMIVGVAILPKHELYRRYNPLLLAEESENFSASHELTSRVQPLPSSPPSHK